MLLFGETQMKLFIQLIDGPTKSGVLILKSSSNIGCYFNQRQLYYKTRSLLAGFYNLISIGDALQ